MINTGANELSHSNYATRRKELLLLVKQLRSIGAQADLDLPRITVIGNQSAGKSSVVEAISGINVPRDSGTCTRCPMECRLSSSSGSWSCQVSIRWEFDSHDKRLEEVSEVPFGATITDKGDVELAIRRAQAAVLNPSVSATSFLTYSLEELKDGARGQKTMQFSRNVVCVDLEGPELTDLFFIDCPGIIQNAESEVVKLVEDLVISHIKGNCLILVALPMTDDIENQKALRLAHQVDREGRRTIGVMTKPDMLTLGSTKARDLWLDVIEGRRHPLAHGYYCTRQPDDAERSGGITSANARIAESTYFNDTSPWSTSVHKHRFGTNNLISTLSTLLVQIIKETLPNLRTETMTCLEACGRELGRLPKPPGNEPATDMFNLVTSFVDDVQRFVAGGPTAGRLVHENRETFAKFKHAIRKTAPNFLPYPNIDQNTSNFHNVLDDGEDGDPAEDLLSEEQPFTLTDMRSHIQKSITRELPGNVPFQAKVDLITSFQDTWASSMNQCFNHVRTSVLSVLFGCIEAKFGRYQQLESDIRISISDLVDRRYKACLPLLEAVLAAEETPFTQNQHYLETCKAKWLAKYKDNRRLEASLEPPTKRAKVTDLNAISDFPDAPPEPTIAAPVFGSSSLHSRNKQKGNVLPSGTKKVSDGRTFASPQAAKRAMVSLSPTASTLQSSDSRDPEKINSILALLADAGYTGLNPEDLGKLNPPDKYETELHVMAEVRGYFQVSYKRVIDNIPSTIDLNFVKAIFKGLQSFLTSELGLGAADSSSRCAKYLAEDPNVIARRDDLVARSKRLESVKTELHNFGL